MPAVSAGNHDDDPSFPCGFHCLTERIPSARHRDWPAERKVDHPNVIDIFQSDGPCNGGDNVRITTGPIAIQNAEGRSD